MKRMSIPAGTVARLNSRLRFSFFGMDTIIYKEGIDEGGKGLSRGRREEIWFFAWAVSVVATLGSLYFSEIKGYEPCELCWYQRILMYPMTVLIGMAVARKDTRMSLYTAVLSGIGMCVSLYHYCLQKLAFFSDRLPACGRIPCTAEYINWFGFITIPFLALTAFVLIFISSLIVWKQARASH